MNASNGQRKVIAIAIWVVGLVIALAIYNHEPRRPYDKPGSMTWLLPVFVASLGAAIGRAIWPRR